VKTLLKISINDDSPIVTLKIEGKLVGPWAVELGRTWHALWASANQMPLRVDIRGVSFADQKGTDILQEIVRETGAEILSDSPLTQYFANQATSGASLEQQVKIAS
jgi:hypothetical protein